jgi:hypothetical protein
MARTACVLLAVVVASLGSADRLSAQRMRGANEPPPPAIGGPQTLFERFADRLDLNGRTQRPEAEQIFTAAADEALPVAQQMNQLRVRLVNAEIDGNSAEARTILEEYTKVATHMAEIEAQAFAKVFAMLDAGQKKRAAEAFHIIAGLFVPNPQTTPARGGGRAGRGRGGQ